MCGRVSMENENSGKNLEMEQKLQDINFRTKL